MFFDLLILKRLRKLAKNEKRSKISFKPDRKILNSSLALLFVNTTLYCPYDTTWSFPFFPFISEQSIATSLWSTRKTQQTLK